MTNRPTRRGLAIGAAALPTSFTMGSAHAQVAPESTLDRVTRTKKLRMGVVSGSPPYFTKDISTGEWTGAAVAMAKSIADVWSAELVFVDTLWPDFSKEHLEQALAEFRRRERRYGGVGL